MTSIETRQGETADIVERLRLCSVAATRYVDAVKGACADWAGNGSAPPPERQFELHGLAWSAAYAAALEALAHWARRLGEAGRLGHFESLLATIATAEYCLQLGHGIAMSQDEIVRPMHLGSEAAAARLLADPAVAAMIRDGARPATKRVLVEHLLQAGPAATWGSDGLDETHAAIRDQFRRFAEERVVAPARGWHEQDVLIPDTMLGELADLGVFGLTVPEAYGGSALGATGMCVVTEELSRGYIGVGSLGTRSEIASELIRLGGTDAQREHYLPQLASGAIIPTAVFTEPNTGSDLGSIQTRAVRDGDVYRIYGAKTWITHAARADLMTLMARTDPDKPGYAGLTMFLAEKPRGMEGNPFPAPGMSGGEIRVLGYRGMKEYEIAFDGFEVPATQVLGGVEGRGFKQLMQTFESARIQTAARAIGVAQNAFELALTYARERMQFGQRIVEFPRVHGKIAWMAAELCLIRQLTYSAAAKRDTGARTDVEAGMAKLLAARLAWSCADNALQIHGGNGYALEYDISRVLCDARILNIFEGAAEIQAGVIARGVLAASS